MRGAWWALALVLGASAPQVAAAQAAGANIEDTDRLGENVLAEAEAMRVLAEAIDAEVQAGTLKLSAEAAAAWPEGRLGWEKVRHQALEGNYGGAYKAARAVRPLLRKAFREAFEGNRPAPGVTDALKAYIAAIGPRADALTRQIENYPLTLEGRESYHVGIALLTDARLSAKKKRWDFAFRQLIDALIEMDKVIYEAYPKAR